MAMTSPRREIALLGFPSVGKTSLALQFTQHKFDANYCTTIANVSGCKHKVCGKDFNIQLFDSRGLTELQRCEDRYFDMHGWVLVYSVTERRSFEVLAEIYDNLKANAGEDKLPIVVVGNKTDLVGDGKREVTVAEGQRFAASVNAIFVESSAKTNENVQRVFELAVKEIEKQSGQPLKPESTCALM
eukprot:m.166224 g.166224  ORF g.166224 m.166224 type:complete len:187 (+) comp31420_c4_seq1:336-896(+)